MKSKLFPYTIRSSGELAGFLGKLGHLLIMDRHHLTINHESNLGTARQKHRLSISCPGHHSKCHSLIHSWSTINVPLPPLEAALHWRPCRWALYAAMSPSEVECYWCKLSSL